MEREFYAGRFRDKHKIEVIVPEKDDRTVVHRIIYEELVLGILKEEPRQAYRQVIERLVSSGAEGVILGCTEVELLISQADSAVPVFPTTRVHVEAAVEAALSDAAIPAS